MQGVQGLETSALRFEMGLRDQGVRDRHELRHLCKKHLIEVHLVMTMKLAGCGENLQARNITAAEIKMPVSTNVRINAFPV
jgi:hypothetical protein